LTAAQQNERLLNALMQDRGNAKAKETEKFQSAVAEAVKVLKSAQKTAELRLYSENITAREHAKTMQSCAELPQSAPLKNAEPLQQQEEKQAEEPKNAAQNCENS